MTESTKKALNFDALKPKKDELESLESIKERKENAAKQLSALISFKDALCSEKAIHSFVRIFNRFWAKEIEIRSELTGTDKNFAQRPSWEHVGKVLFTMGRLLEIDYHPLVSRPEEITSCRRSQMQLIVYLRSVLFALPGIFLQLGEGHKDRYFDQWLSYLFRIVHNCLREFRVKDLHKVHACGGILGHLHQDGDIETIVFDESVDQGEVPVPAAIQQLHSVNVKGALSEKLKQEKATRLSSSGLINRNDGGRHSRFGGVIYSKTDIGSDVKLDDILMKPIKPKKAARSYFNDDAAKTEGEEGEGEGEDGTNKSDPFLAEKDTEKEKEEEPEVPKGAIRPQGIVRRGIQLSRPQEDALPQAAAKTMKKNATYSRDSTSTELVDTRRLLGRVGQEASVVVASVIDLICHSKGLNEMIRRVNNDLIRDDGIFLDDMKLTYFEILSKCLSYNRLKLASDKKAFDAKRQRDLREGLIDEKAPKWEPDLRNMSAAMDKLTENHILKTMEDAVTRKRFHEVVKAMEVYKEVICYIRVQLESGNRFHRDFAVAYLYRLFYATVERTDPLSKLMSEWKPGTYSRRHLNCLVELVHETMKTLDLARSIFSDPEEIEKARKSKGRGSAGIEMYTSAAYRFDPNEYFRRLVNNQSVRIYTRVLERYASNEESVNHYAFVFLRRMSYFKVEQTLPCPHPSVLQSEALKATARIHFPAPTLDGPLSLMYLLFNVSTLSVFSTILSDRHLEKQTTWSPTLALIKEITRNFFHLADKNNCLFVEALFQHPHPQNFIEKIDNLYEAQTYKPGPNSRAAQQKGLSGRYDSDVEEDELAKARAEDAGFIVPDGGDDDMAEDGEGDGEFDENDDNVQAVTKAQVKQNKAEKRRLKSLEKSARSGKKVKASKKNASADNSKKSSSKSDGKSWSESEDETLKELYDLYKGSVAIFSIITIDSDMQAHGTDRSTRDIEKRCIELGLHEGDPGADADGQSSDGEDAEEMTQTQTQSMRVDDDEDGSEQQATQEQISSAMNHDSDDGATEDEDEAPKFVRKTDKRKAAATETAASPEEETEKSAWDSDPVDAKRFDDAMDAAEQSSRKRFKKTSLKKNKVADSDDEGELVF
jgi:hypothetical protein